MTVYTWQYFLALTPCGVPTCALQLILCARAHRISGLEREIVVWNPYTGKPVISLEGHQTGIVKLQVNSEFEQVWFGPAHAYAYIHR